MQFFKKFNKNFLTWKKIKINYHVSVTYSFNFLCCKCNSIGLDSQTWKIITGDKYFFIGSVKFEKYFNKKIFFQRIEIHKLTQQKMKMATRSIWSQKVDFAVSTTTTSFCKIFLPSQNPHIQPLFFRSRYISCFISTNPLVWSVE